MKSYTRKGRKVQVHHLGEFCDPTQTQATTSKYGLTFVTKQLSKPELVSEHTKPLYLIGQPEGQEHTKVYKLMIQLTVVGPEQSYESFALAEWEETTTYDHQGNQISHKNHWPQTAKVGASGIVHRSSIYPNLGELDSNLIKYLNTAPEIVET
jgi:hypothetical protein